MVDEFSYQPVTSVSRIAALSDDAIARIADGLRISFNLFNPRSTNANGIPVRSHLRHSKDRKRLNKASSVIEDAPRVFSLLSCFMVLQGSGLQVILGIFDIERVNSRVIRTDSHFRGDSASPTRLEGKNHSDQRTGYRLLRPKQRTSLVATLKEAIRKARNSFFICMPICQVGIVLLSRSVWMLDGNEARHLHIAWPDSRQLRKS